jgi:hypothetical protein
MIVLLASPLLLAACGSKGSTGTGGHTSGTGGHAAGTGGAPGTGGHGTGGHGGGAPSCGTDGWTTYGHDARRTSASDGCVAGAVDTAWRYAPTAPAGKTVKAVFNAIARSDGVFLAWSASNDPYLGTTAADRLDATGKLVWSFDSGTDSNLGNWPSIAWTSLILNEDGIYYVDLATGMKTGGNGVDNWGQTLTDGASLYVVNDSHVDGPGIYVGAYDDKVTSLWQQNTYGMCRIDAGDIAGGIALDGGTLFYAPNYSLGAGVMLSFSSGVYAFAAKDGAPQWFQPASATSGISAGGGMVYLIEGNDQLVARKQTDGSVAWSAMATAAGTQAPALAGGRVIVATATGILAFDGKTGAPAWTAALPGATAQAFNLMFSGGCVAGSGQWSGNAFGTAVATTTVAAALGSGTVVVTATDGVHVLSLADGSELGKVLPAQASGPVRNPVIVGGTVYVVDSGGVLALTGK